MSQRESGYARIDGDAYETPEWVTNALIPHLPKNIAILEPACGSGKMQRALHQSGFFHVTGTDIKCGFDFLQCKGSAADAIVTNPPYSLAQAFIGHAVALMMPHRGLVAMLLRTDFDHARSRAVLFDGPPFAKKLVLRRRIRWIENSTGSPSFNHAWFIWDWRHNGAPTLAYGP